MDEFSKRIRPIKNKDRNHFLDSIDSLKRREEKRRLELIGKG